MPNKMIKVRKVLVQGMYQKEIATSEARAQGLLWSGTQKVKDETLSWKLTFSKLVPYEATVHPPSVPKPIYESRQARQAREKIMPYPGQEKGKRKEWDS